MHIVFIWLLSISSLDSHWIRMQLSGMMDDNPCFDEIENFFPNYTLANFDRLFKFWQLCQNFKIVTHTFFIFDIVVKYDTLAQNIW